MPVALKPFSVNGAWKGRHFNTPEKTAYEWELWNLVRFDKPKIKLKKPYQIHFKFFVLDGQDYDNCIKVTQDILCRAYDINDKDIHFATIEKIVVKKGKERFEYKIKSYSKK